MTRSSNVRRHPVALVGEGKLCNGAWKRGQDSHFAVFSLSYNVVVFYNRIWNTAQQPHDNGNGIYIHLALWTAKWSSEISHSWVIYKVFKSQNFEKINCAKSVHGTFQIGEAIMQLVFNLLHYSIKPCICSCMQYVLYCEELIALTHWLLNLSNIFVTISLDKGSFFS